MTPEKLADKVLFTQREVLDSDQTEFVAQLCFTTAKRVDRFLLQGNIENPKIIINRLQKDMVRLLFYDVYVQHREEFYRYMHELRCERDWAPNSKIDQILKQMMALFD